MLQPLWQTFPGKREGLAEAARTQPSTLSAINSGARNLGPTLGVRIADALGVSLLELGAPLGAADASDVTLVTRLEELGARVAYLLEREAALSLELEDARSRLAQLETESKPRRASATRRKTGA